MVWATRFELTFTPWDVPPVTQQDYFNRNEYLKIQSVVWATRFELATSQSRTARATNCATPRYVYLITKTQDYHNYVIISNDMSKLYKRTKILATVGPAVFTEEKIAELVMAGVNCCRLNFSHGSYEERDEQIAWIKKAAEKKGRSVAILQDIQGPKIRLGVIKDNHYEVKPGDELILDYAVAEHDGSNLLPVQYNLAERMKVGEPLFIFDGKIRSTVTEIVSDTAIKVKVENEGTIMSRKGLNLPDTDFGGDVITEKDMADIEFGASRDFDYVAMSFVQSAEDIEKLRQIMLSHGSTAQIIAKIETKKAIESDEKMEAIVKATDGIMVARGDMAVEAGNEVVPIVQKKLIALCRQYGKIVIVATQMMGSMVDNPEPSRAEVSDVANAVMQGADAVMLSGESAKGKYPVEAVKMMADISKRTDEFKRYKDIDIDGSGNITVTEAISRGAVSSSEALDAKLILCWTKTGRAARMIRKYGPTVPIIALTDSEQTARQLSLVRGVRAYVEKNLDVADDFFRKAKEIASVHEEVKNGDLVVFVTGISETGTTNTFKIERIGE